MKWLVQQYRSDFIVHWNYKFTINKDMDYHFYRNVLKKLDNEN